MEYVANYINSIGTACRETSYTVSNEQLSREHFFDQIVDLTNSTRSNGGRIFFVGNGASAAFCNHMALDWSKNGKIRAFSLSDSALLTALANDYSFEDAFVEFLKINACNSNDIVATVSSSGNSPNVVNVLKFCQGENINTIGFSGLKTNNLSTQHAKYSLYVPVKTYGMAECIHQIFLHLWLDKYMEIFEWNREDFQNMNSDKFKL